MADRAETLAIQREEALVKKHARRIRLGKREAGFIRMAISYFFLGIGALFMLFPAFWMITAALKPEWQIFARPVIWIPQYWHKANAGDTVRVLNIWIAPHPETGEGQEVLELGTRRYTSAVVADDLPELLSAPSGEVSEAQARDLGDGVVLNVRTWNGQDVVAVGRDGDNLLVVPFDKLTNVQVLPLDEVNAGDRAKATVGDYELQARQVEVDGQMVNVLALGPQIQLKTVTRTDAAQGVVLLPAAKLGEAETLPLDLTEINQYVLNDDPSGARYILIEQAVWLPTMDLELVREHAFAVPEESVVLDDEPVEYNLAVFPKGIYTDENGNTQEVVVAFREEKSLTGKRTILVMPPEVMGAVQMIPAASLLDPFAELIDGMNVRYKDFTLPTVDDETIDMERAPDRVVILGSRQDMALLMPVEGITQAFDAPGAEVNRKTTVSFKFSNFTGAMAREMAGANFITFFKNSIIISGLSIIGHLFSVTVVAYAFARMQAPGKNLLFMIVLATMMMPWFVTVIPIYMIFRDLKMIDTLYPMFLRSFFGNAFLIFLMRQFFTTIPMELEEAAFIDGASRLQTFFRIMLPLVTPALATIVIFTFLWTWNDLFGAVLYLNSPQNYTVSIGLNLFQDQYRADFTLLMAAATIVMLPTVLLFFFAQRFFIEGITLTGLKG